MLLSPRRYYVLKLKRAQVRRNTGPLYGAKPVTDSRTSPPRLRSRIHPTSSSWLQDGGSVAWDRMGEIPVKKYSPTLPPARIAVKGSDHKMLCADAELRPMNWARSYKSASFRQLFLTLSSGFAQEILPTAEKTAEKKRRTGWEM